MSDRSVRVRAGNAMNSSELYEHAFDSADEANTALLEAGVLTAEQVPDVSKLAGTGLQLHGITAEQLEEAGLKRHGSETPYGGIPEKVQPSTTGNPTGQGRPAGRSVQS